MQQPDSPNYYRGKPESPRTFPRPCAHRGLSQACPENTLPAFAAALSTGAQELEFDLWRSRDGVAVVCHDESVERTTDGRGKIADMRWADIRKLDASVKNGPAWRGVRMPRLEEVLDLTAGRMELNIHIKETGANGQLVKQTCDTLRQRSLFDSAYIAGGVEVLQIASAYAPELPRDCLADFENPFLQIKTAEKYACRRIQTGQHVTAEHTRAARAAGLICNMFWSDDAREALDYVNKGIQVILTNCANQLIADGFPILQDTGME